MQIALHLASLSMTRSVRVVASAVGSCTMPVEMERHVCVVASMTFAIFASQDGTHVTVGQTSADECRFRFANHLWHIAVYNVETEEDDLWVECVGLDAWSFMDTALDAWVAEREDTGSVVHETLCYAVLLGNSLDELLA